jgi:heme oxygenase (biliverdin-producing, ferredoxin)
MSLMADPPGADRLSVRLRRDNSITQGNGFLDALTAGRLPWEAYADLAAQHWFLYESLELATHAMVDDPVARAFIFPELIRLPALEADLHFLHGPRWTDRIAALPATTTYCTRLRHAAYTSPVGFIAHHYARYVSDLTNCGRLGRAVVRAYGLSRDGHRFFAFPGVDPGALLTYYRRLLDALPWSRLEQDAFLTEVTDAHRLNLAVLDDLRHRWL